MHKHFLLPVGAIDLVRGAAKRVGQLCATRPAGPGGHVFAHIDVARKHAVQQFLVGSRVHLERSVVGFRVQP